MAVRGRPRNFDREHVLAQAMEVFWSRGYEGASLGALTSAMGLAAPSLYAAFESKERLFYAALTHYLEKWGAYRIEILNQSPTAYEGIYSLLRTTVQQFYSTETPRGCLVVLAALSGSNESQTVQDVLIAERRKSVDLIRERILRGQAEGDTPTTVDADELAEFYATVFFGLSVQTRNGVSEAKLLAVTDIAMRGWPAT